VNRIVAARIASVDENGPATLVERLLVERTNNESISTSANEQSWQKPEEKVAASVRLKANPNS
jgi:hypothetical protein